jgi:predicted aminopeptidase
MARATALLLLLVVASTSGCSPVYVLRAGWEEAKILSRRQPIDALVANPSTPAETREKLALVLQARTFAQRVLDLDAGQSYTTFSQLDSDTLVLVVTAAHRDRFQAHTWWFPIVGHVPYKGFFSEARAQEEVRRLDDRGMDTSMRPAAAFSTLGWFNDPLVSTLLRYDDLSLANTVIHELVHNTIFVPGQVAFNESFANFVGGRGAAEFFCRREGPDARLCQDARAAWTDQIVFGGYLEELVEELEALYGREDITSDRKVELREEIFEAARRRFREEIRPRLTVSTFTAFERDPLNNATLISRRLYYRRLDLFEAVHQQLGGDLPTTIQAVMQAVREGGDPFTALEGMLAD